MQGHSSALHGPVQVIRALNITAFSPIMARTGHGVSLAEACIEAWSGLRGLVGLVLALSVQEDGVLLERIPRYQAQAFFLLGTTLVLTTVVQGSTFLFLLQICPC